jgi:hypothetical protein
VALSPTEEARSTLAVVERLIGQQGEPDLLGPEGQGAVLSVLGMLTNLSA